MSQFIETGVPSWLQPPKLDRGPPYTEWTVDRALSLVSIGHSVAAICRDDPAMPEAAELLKYLHSTPELEARYHEAQRVGAEVLIDETMEVAQGTSRFDNVVPLDINRAGLIIKTAQWIAERRNKRYRPSTNVEVTKTIDISKAMERASARVGSRRPGLVIEGEVVDGD